MKRGTATLVVVAMLAALPLGAALAATATADYQLQNNFTTSVGAAPDLVVAGTLEGGAFAADSVGGSPRTVYRFPFGQGFDLQNASSLMPSGAYTIAMLFEFDDVVGYTRVLDFKNGTSDAGVYVNGGFLLFFGASIAAPTPVVEPNAYVQVVLTRDAAGQFTAYAYGQEQFTFADPNNLAVVDPTANNLRFFIDDSSVGGEMSAGSVARIRVWDGAMTTSEVAALDDSPPPPPDDPRCESDPNAECGTDGDDDLVGTPGADVIFGGLGDDNIESGEGDDDVSGDAGNDTIDTGGGNDVADGGSGNDRVFAKAGNDLVKGGAGDDLLKMAEGLDEVNGGGGRDTIEGGPGFDKINGGKGLDICFFTSRREKRAMKSCETKRPDKRAH